MNRNRLTLLLASCTVVLAIFPLNAVGQAQKQPAVPQKPAVATTLVAPSEKDINATRQQLIKLLRLTPTLTTVVAHDPSLLANTDYVNRNNPELGQFLAVHPEIARNPEFYLFTHMNPQDGSPDEALERAVWPEYIHNNQSNNNDRVMDITGPFFGCLAFLGFLGALVWLTRTFIEGRRWNRVFKLQSEVHSRMIDKFSSSQELLHYMETEAGRRFLEAAPINVNSEPGQKMPNAVARILTPLQIGVVLTLLGIGLLLIRTARPEMEIPFLIFGTLALMPGIGFILSAGISWLLANRLGLMPKQQYPTLNPPSDSQDFTEPR